MNGLKTTAIAAATVLACAWTAMAAPEKTPAKKPIPTAVVEPVVDPKQIWPASLTGLAGRYVFVQVASPGGLWETVSNEEGTEKRRQVSVNEISAAARERILKAEIVIAVSKGPVHLEASQRLSPAKRGVLRFYEEEALGTITVRNLPGVQGREDAQDFSGPVLLRLDHQSHSNPSVSGVLRQRQQQEQTWGAATLDYADLAAITIPKDPKEEGQTIVSNARVLRSGGEIFAFVEWREKEGGSVRETKGAVRLLRVMEDPVVPAGTEGAGAK